MIGRPVKGTGFRGLLDYLGEKEHARRIGGDMAGRNSRELAHEFGLLRRQKPQLRRAVAHMFLRPAPGEFLSETQWTTIASFYLAGMGFSDSPHVLYPEDEPHPHLHIVASRITYSGRVVSDSNDYARSAELLRKIERSYGLRVVPTHPELRSPRPGDYRRAQRIQTLPLKTRLQQVVGDVTYPLPLKDYLDHLHRHGVSMLPNIARTGRVSGISYVFEGQVMKASELGRQYTWGSLAQRLTSSPDDPRLLAAERAHAQAALSPLSTDAPAPPVLARVPDGTSLRDLLSRLARSEEALLSSTLADYAERALAYDARATEVERLLTAALDPTQPHSSEAEHLARTLLAEPGPPPTPRTVERLEKASEAVNDLLVDRVSGEDHRSQLVAADESFRQTIERSLALRRDLHVLELRAAALVANPPGIALEERAPYVELATIVTNRVELTRIDRLVGLHSVEPEFTDPGGSKTRDLRSRGEEIIQSTFTADSRLTSGPSPAVLRETFEHWPSDTTTLRSEAIANRSLEALRSARSDLISGPGDPAERLLSYLEVTRSVREHVLDSLHPHAFLFPADDHVLAGHDIARFYLQDAPLRPLTLDAITALEHPSREAFRALLDNPRPSQTALLHLIEANHNLDQIAFQVAVARQQLSFSNEGEKLRQAVSLEGLYGRIELSAQIQEHALLEQLVQRDSAYGVDLHLLDRSIDLLRDTEYQDYEYSVNAYDPARQAPPPVPDTPEEGWRFVPQGPADAQSPDLRSGDESRLSQGAQGDERGVEPPDPRDDFYEELPYPAGVDTIEPQEPWWVPDPVEPAEAAALAEAFRTDARFSPEPAFFLPPTQEELPRLAAEAHQAFRLLEESTDNLRLATPEIYGGLALAQASHAVLVENLDQRFATFGLDPVPRDLPEDRLLAYLETRLQLHETLAAPPSPDRDDRVSSLQERLAELSPAPEPYPTGPQLFQNHREAYARLDVLLVDPSATSRGEFREAVSQALEHHAALDRYSYGLEARLHALAAEHAHLSARLENPADPHPIRLYAIERESDRIEASYYEARIAIADRDLHLLERHLRAHPSSETLDHYAQLLLGRESIAAALRERRPEGRPATSPPNLAEARETLLREPSESNFNRFREAASAAFEAAGRGSFASTVQAFELRRDELAQALKAAPPDPRTAYAELRDPARRYVAARHELDDYAPRPPRRGTTFDYAAHAREARLSSQPLDRLRQSAVSGLRRSPAANSISPPRPIEAHHPGVSRPEAHRLAVRRLQVQEAALERKLAVLQRLERRTPPGQKPQASPETLRRLVVNIDSYRQALDDVDRLSHSRLLTPLNFLRHRAFEGRPRQALASWTGYAARKGLRPPQVRGALRSLGLSFAAGAAGRAAQHLATSFLRDQVHER